MNKTENILLAVITLSLERISNDALAAANLALTGFGDIPKINRGHDALFEAGLINEDGQPKTELLGQALSFEINRRLDAGTWV